ncbi:hypothetical protein [Halalkalibacter urbisdiaboli]|uniref:hypothetical protein n=1 Tax=Halalkalibacter urbisdiaboli TaxID=1960589 RepID=UPI000B433FFE|nr:hypothetical protein [Halalkalibacter urbisdiaboli]
MNVPKLMTSAKQVFKMMANFIGTNTFYIALNDGKTNRIVQAFNKEELLVVKGSEHLYMDSL